MSRKSMFWIILFYLFIGISWLVGGNWMINQLFGPSTPIELQYLYAIKNIVFLLISIGGGLYFLGTYYKNLLLKERNLNEKLRESRDDLSQLLNTHDLVTKATSDVIWDYDIAKDELIWLTGYSELFGYEDGAVNRDSFWNMQRIHEDDRDRIIIDFKELIAFKKRKWTAEYRYQCKDGTFKHVRDRGYLVLDENDKPVRMVGAIQDMQLVKQYAFELELKNEKLKEIAWLNSHEVRRPLSNLLGLIPMLRSSTDDPDALIQFVDFIEKSAQELDETVGKINAGTF